MKIINYENKDYIFKILKSQLNSDLRRYKNEIYYVATKNSVICGISRYSILTEEDLAKKTSHKPSPFRAESSGGQF
jgi:hypothetical protein